MGEIKVKEKDVVVPGEVLADGMDYIPGTGTYREKDNVYASRVGLINIEGKVLKITPLSGTYIPKRDDVIIGKVIDVLMSGWRIDTASGYSAMLTLKDGSTDFISKSADLTRYFALGDVIMTRIVNVTSQMLIDVSMKGPGLRKLKGGRIVKINCNKVPRVIGKQGSMVSMIKQATDCRILVGQNGLIWIDGKPQDEAIAYEAIKFIEENSHISGLTEKMKERLEKATGKKIEMARPDADRPREGGERSYEREGGEYGLQ